MPTYLHFRKYHGAGNDFIIFQQDPSLNLSSDDIRKLCDRHFGIGADGLIIIEASTRAAFKMIYYNADGFEGSMCGNGGRCAAAFAYSLGWIEKTADFEAYDGMHHVEIIDDQHDHFQIRLGMSKVSTWHIADNYILLNTGSPHYVCLVDDVKNTAVQESGKAIRYDGQISPEGVNVNFVELHGNSLNMRTYERGVEAETLACGTGVTAAAIAASLWKGGNRFEVNMPGGRLEVAFNFTGTQFENIVLTGPVAFVFEGVVKIPM